MKLNRKARRALEKKLGESFPIDRLMKVYNSYYVIRGLSLTDAMIDMIENSVARLDNMIYDDAFFQYALDHNIQPDSPEYYDMCENFDYSENHLVKENILDFARWDGVERVK